MMRDFFAQGEAGSTVKIVLRSAIAAVAAAVAFAGTGTATVTPGAVTRSCVHEVGSRVISGSVVVTSSEPGETVVLFLYGTSAPDGAGSILLQTLGPIQLVVGTHAYAFSFANVEVERYAFYEIGLDSHTGLALEVIDAEAECIPPAVPETPSPALLVLTGGLAVGLVLIVSGARAKTAAARAHEIGRRDGPAPR